MPKGIYTRKLFKPVYDRLMAKVTKTDDCWLFTGSKSPFGHGQIMEFVNGKKRLSMAHRVSWEFHFGAIPRGLCILHKCDVPNCVNPDHLFIGTKLQNMQDMRNKGRQKYGRKSSNAKLTEQDVDYIRTSDLKQQELANMFNVSQPLISEIKSLKRWA